VRRITSQNKTKTVAGGCSQNKRNEKGNKQKEETCKVLPGFARGQRDGREREEREWAFHKCVCQRLSHHKPEPGLPEIKAVRGWSGSIETFLLRVFNFRKALG